MYNIRKLYPIHTNGTWQYVFENYIRYFGNFKNTTYSWYPEALTINKLFFFIGMIVVTDSNNQNVQCFDSVTGCARMRFGQKGRSPGQMQRPTGIALLHNGNLAIADYDNKCVSVFEPSGKFVNRIGAGKLLGKSRNLMLLHFWKEC